MRQLEIICKSEVRFKRFTPAAAWFLHVLDGMAETGGEGYPPQLVITSANDSTHMEGSRHYMDEAWDLRSKNIHVAVKDLFRKRLEAMLNSHPVDKNKFTVLLENLGEDNEHFHIQVKKDYEFLS